jgi:hypothetical protein
VPRGTTVNANYIVEALGTFMKILRKKRPQMVAGDWLFCWDNAPDHTVAKVTDWLAARDIKSIEHLPYLPALALADYFLFPRVKKELAGLTLTQDTFKKEWEGPSGVSRRRTSPRCSGDGFSTTKKCVLIGGGYVDKS